MRMYVYVYVYVYVYMYVYVYICMCMCMCIFVCVCVRVCCVVAQLKKHADSITGVATTETSAASTLEAKPLRAATDKAIQERNQRLRAPLISVALLCAVGLATCELYRVDVGATIMATAAALLYWICFVLIPAVPAQ